jgi:preprotein translocase subunit SecY
MLFQTIANVFRIPELRSKILFTLGMLAVYRIGFWIPVPGVDQSALSQYFETQVNSGSAAGRLAQYVSIFSGGSFGQSTIFGLGIMPYITASIIFQLFGTVSPKLKKPSRRKAPPAARRSPSGPATPPSDSASSRVSAG